jgi:hypothetical protein
MPAGRVLFRSGRGVFRRPHVPLLCCTATAPRRRRRKARPHSKRATTASSSKERAPVRVGRSASSAAARCPSSTPSTCMVSRFPKQRWPSAVSARETADPRPGRCSSSMAGEATRPRVAAFCETRLAPGWLRSLSPTTFFVSLPRGRSTAAWARSMCCSLRNAVAPVGGRRAAADLALHRDDLPRGQRAVTAFWRRGTHWGVVWRM